MPRIAVCTLSASRGTPTNLPAYLPADRAGWPSLSLSAELKAPWSSACRCLRRHTFEKSAALTGGRGAVESTRCCVRVALGCRQVAIGGQSIQRMHVFVQTAIAEAFLIRKRVEHPLRAPIQIAAVAGSRPRLAPASA